MEGGGRGSGRVVGLEVEGDEGSAGSCSGGDDSRVGGEVEILIGVMVDDGADDGFDGGGFVVVVGGGKEGWEESVVIHESEADSSGCEF